MCVRVFMCVSCGAIHCQTSHGSCSQHLCVCVICTQMLDSYVVKYWPLLYPNIPSFVFKYSQTTARRRAAPVRSTCVCACVYMCVCESHPHIHTHTHSGAVNMSRATSGKHTHTHTHTHAHTHTYKIPHKQTPTDTNTHPHTHMLTHTHLQTHSHTRICAANTSL